MLELFEEEVATVPPETDEQPSWYCKECWRMITEAEAANYEGMCRSCFEDGDWETKTGGF